MPLGFERRQAFQELLQLGGRGARCFVPRLGQVAGDLDVGSADRLLALADGRLPRGRQPLLRGGQVAQRLLNLGLEHGRTLLPNQVAHGLRLRLLDHSPGPPGRGLGLDALIPQFRRESLAPFLQVGLGPLEPAQVVALRLDRQVDVRLLGVDVQGEQVLVVVGEGLLGEASRRLQDCLVVGSLGHREDDVDGLRPPPLAVSGGLEAPFLEDLLDLLEALDLFTALVLGLELAVAGDVGQVRQAVRPALPAAADLDDDLGRPLGDPGELAGVGADREGPAPLRADWPFQGEAQLGHSQGIDARKAHRGLQRAAEALHSAVTRSVWAAMVAFNVASSSKSALLRLSPPACCRSRFTAWAIWLTLRPMALSSRLDSYRTCSASGLNCGTSGAIWALASATSQSRTLPKSWARGSISASSSFEKRTVMRSERISGC